MAKTKAKPAEPVAQEPEIVEVPDVFLVEDVLSTDPSKPRIHEFPNDDGTLTRITFPCGQAVEVSAGIVAKFNLFDNTGFSVTDSQNRRFRSRAQSLDESRTTLLPDEVIAKLTWLKKPALIKIAEKNNIEITSDNNEADIIAKLIAVHVPVAVETIPEDDDEDIILDVGGEAPAPAPVEGDTSTPVKE